jgi:hypothetical protein
VLNRVLTTTLNHLRPHTTYHYRIVASYCRGCRCGRSSGTDGIFTTLPLPQLPGSVTWHFASGHTTTSVVSLMAQLPRGADRILVTCTVRGFPARRWSVRSTLAVRRCRHGRCSRRVTHLSRVDVSPRLRGRALSVGGLVTIEALRSGDTGIVFRFAIRASREPAFSKAWLVNGARKPAPC